MALISLPPRPGGDAVTHCPGPLREDGRVARWTLWETYLCREDGGVRELMTVASSSLPAGSFLS